MPVTPVLATGQVEVTPQWGNFVDVANDVKPWLQEPTSMEIALERRLQLVTDFACTWVQNYLARPVAPLKFERRFDGWSGKDGAFVALPYYPILKIEKCVEWWGTSGPRELIEQTPAEQSTISEAFQVDHLRGYLTRTFMGLVARPWFPGLKNIEVAWQAGYQPVPPDIKIATLELIAHWWRNTQQASRATPSPIEYSPEVASGLWQGVPLRITALLSPYVRQGIG